MSIWLIQPLAVAREWTWYLSLLGISATLSSTDEDLQSAAESLPRTWSLGARDSGVFSYRASTRTGVFMYMMQLFGLYPVNAA